MEQRRRGFTCLVIRQLRAIRSTANYSWRVSDRLEEVHHIRGRLGSLLMDKRYWMAVSKAGHNWIHAHPKDARVFGWLAQPGEWNRNED